MPATTFHWIRVQTFCYATEKSELLEETFTALVGDEEFDEEISEGEHGNTMVIMEKRLTRQKEFESLFCRLGPEILAWLDEDADNRIDDDCTFYMRLDKQEAVQGRFVVAHHGDVISVTGRIQSHPARKEVAVRNLREFVRSLPVQAQSE